LPPRSTRPSDLLAAMALCRTLGPAIAEICSTQNVPTSQPNGGAPRKTTLRSIGSLLLEQFGLYLRTRSCLPPITISPAGESAAVRILINTSLLTSAPRFGPRCGKGSSCMGRTRRRLDAGESIRANSFSVTTNLAPRNEFPRQASRKVCVGVEPVTSEYRERLSWVAGGSTLYNPPRFTLASSIWTAKTNIPECKGWRHPARELCCVNHRSSSWMLSYVRRTSALRFFQNISMRDETTTATPQARMPIPLLFWPQRS